MRPFVGPWRNHLRRHSDHLKSSLETFFNSERGDAQFLFTVNEQHGRAPLIPSFVSSRLYLLTTPETHSRLLICISEPTSIHAKLWNWLRSDRVWIFIWKHLITNESLLSVTHRGRFWRRSPLVELEALVTTPPRMEWRCVRKWALLNKVCPGGLGNV